MFDRKPNKTEPYFEKVDNCNEAHICRPNGEILALVNVLDLDKKYSVQVRYFISPKYKDSYTRKFTHMHAALQFVQEKWENN